MDRAEHLAWAKQRALEYVDLGEQQNGIVSLISDMGKHPETEICVTLAFSSLVPMFKHTPDEVRKWIESFV